MKRNNQKARADLSLIFLLVLTCRRISDAPVLV